jgi:hypothetical protein
MLERWTAYLFLVDLPRSEIVTTHDLFTKGKTSRRSNEGQIYLQYKEFKSELATNWNNDEEVHFIGDRESKTKLKWFKCGRNDHIKRKCRTKRARGETNMVCGPLDEDIFSEDEVYTGEAFMVLGLTETMEEIAEEENYPDVNTDDWPTDFDMVNIRNDKVKDIEANVTTKHASYENVTG